MILVKNKLKRLKRDNEDDMLYHLKYSHLENISDEEDFIPDNRTYRNKATQFPNIKNKSTQTYNKEMNDKETDTFDDLHEIDYKYMLHGKSHRLKSNEKLRGDFLGQVNTVPVIEKDDENKDRESDDDNFLTRNVKRGFRLAEFALNSSIATANLTMSIADALVETNLLGNNSNNDEEKHEHINENDLEVISVNSSPPMTVSSATPPQTVHSSIPSSPQSIPVPTSPQSSRASSRSRSSLYNPKKRM